MSKSAGEEQSHWDQLIDSFDLLFSRVNDIGAIQQELKTQLQANSSKVDQCSKDRQFIAQQGKANGQAVAQLTLRQFDEEAQSDSESSGSVLFDDEEPQFENVFAKHKSNAKPGPSKKPRTKPDNKDQDSLPHHALPKMQFATFDGSHP